MVPALSVSLSALGPDPRPHPHLPGLHSLLSLPVSCGGFSPPAESPSVLMPPTPPCSRSGRRMVVEEGRWCGRSYSHCSLSVLQPSGLIPWHDPSPCSPLPPLSGPLSSPAVDWGGGKGPPSMA